MHEPISNIGLVCGDCAQETKKATQKALKGVKPADLIGKYVKLAVPVPNTKTFEYLWFKVLRLSNTKGEELEGRLDNDPIILKNHRCGDIIDFSLHEIEAIYGQEESSQKAGTKVKRS